MRIIEKLLRGQWDDDFLKVLPGQKIKAVYYHEKVIEAVCDHEKVIEAV